MNAVITVLWIGEEKPDFVSSIIQFCLQRNYSHNAFIFEGMMWHGTFGDPKYEGFCDEPIEHAMIGCKVRYCKRVETNFTVEELRGYLRARRGTPYSMAQNSAAMRPELARWFVTAWLFRSGKTAVNCSEVVAEVCQSKDLDFGDLDLVKPTDTFRVIQPDLCNHNHLEQKNNS